MHIEVPLRQAGCKLRQAGGLKASFPRLLVTPICWAAHICRAARLAMEAQVEAVNPAAPAQRLQMSPNGECMTHLG